MAMPSSSTSDLPFVSVLIDTYNHERFIEQALSSVLSQDFPEDRREILVVDDGSTDSTPAILRKYEPHIRVLRKSNGGQASAFNFAIPQCRGDIVIFLDADDWWGPGKLRAVVDAFRANPALGIVGHAIYEVFEGAEQYQLVPNEGRREFQANAPEGAQFFRLHKAFFGTSRMAIRSELLRKIGPVPESLRVEADEYLFTLAAVFAPALLLPQLLSYYRIHGSNGFQIANGNPDALRRKYRILADLAKALDARLAESRIDPLVAKIIVESVQNESDVIRLQVDGGRTGEAFSAEMKSFRMYHSDASPFRLFLKTLSTAPAFVLPPRAYYAFQNGLVANPFYRKLRAKWMPFSKLAHIDRESAGPS